MHDALLPSQYGRTLHKPVFILFLIFFGIAWVRLLLEIKLPQSANWAPGLAALFVCGQWVLLPGYDGSLVSLPRETPMRADSIAPRPTDARKGA